VTARSDRLRVLYVASGVAPRFGGLYKDIPGLCTAMSRSGFDVQLFATNADGAGGSVDVPIERNIHHDGYRVQYFRGIPLPGRWVGFGLSPGFARALRIAVPKADVVHIYSLYNFPSTYAAYLARRYGIPYVIEPHGSLDDVVFEHHRGRKKLYERLIERRNLFGAAAVRFLSEQEVKNARGTIGEGLRQVVIPSGIDMETFVPRSSAEEVLRRYRLPQESHDHLLMFVGRLHRKKGLDLLAKAFVKIVALEPHAHLAILGPDEGMGDEVRALLESADASDRATFLGLVTGQDKIDLMAAASVVVIPSYSENFCNVAIEAMALRRPVIVSTGVAIGPAIEGAGAGIMVKPEADQVAAATLWLLRNTESAARIGEAGYCLVNREFKWDRVSELTGHLYLSLNEASTH
jgi:glycosyltransferase involved in cell wall biosynthesis